ncbi:MAG: hypothetical protein ACRDZ7_21990 [Acidimicrobiia bacterium]
MAVRLGRPVAAMVDEASLEDRALELRQQGKSFAAIARTLGYERGGYEALRAFKRALRRRPAAEQATLKEQELVRLTSMEEGFRADTTLSPEERNRCLGAVAALRAMLRIG